MKKNRFVGVIGNFLEHYDNALFGLLAPFISPFFFGDKDPLSALILTYGMLPLGFLTKPLGALFFGWIGDFYGRKQALFYSLIGTAVVTVGIGFLPLYKDIGFWSPLFLAFARMLQSFFSAGESSGGALFILEQTCESKRAFISSCYDASSTGGILFASLLVSFISINYDMEFSWRILFWAGGLTALFGAFFRKTSKNSKQGIKVTKLYGRNILSLINQVKLPLLSIILVSGFSHITYSLAFTLMNGYLPLVTALSKSEVIKVNTALLILDLFLLPFFGFLANRFGKERIMLVGAFGLVLGAIPLFSLLHHATLLTTVIVRIIIIIFGVAFAAPYYAWAMERIAPSCRYLVLSLGGVLGSQLIGAPTSAICLWMYKHFKICWAPGLYLVIVGLAAGIVVYSHLRVEKARVIKT